MPNYRLRLAFVGTNYHGWQIQPGVPTIQGTLKEAIEKIVCEEIKLIGCCRTDAGVHAKDYIANFWSSKKIETYKLLRGLNSLLPKDIGVYEVEEIEEDFNSRYSVKGKVYLYRIWNSYSRDPFLYPFSWQITRNLNLESIGEAVRILSGFHDFRSFAKLEDEKDTSVDLKIEFSKKEELVELRFIASHFLRYMVRRLVGAIVWTAEGKLRPEDLKRYLEGENFPYTAPAKGLTLEKVLL